MELVEIRYPLWKRALFSFTALAVPGYLIAGAALGVWPGTFLLAILILTELTSVAVLVIMSLFVVRLDEKEILLRELATRRMPLSRVASVRVEKAKRGFPFYTKRTEVEIRDREGGLLKIEWDDEAASELVSGLQKLLPGKVTMLERFMAVGL